MGSPCLFTRQRALKMGYFYQLRVKNSNRLYTELSLGYSKDTKFYIESKASFIEISSIASFELFLVAWLRECCTFSDSSVVSLKFWPWPKYVQQGTTFPKNILFYYQTFFFSKCILDQTVLSKYLMTKAQVICTRSKENISVFRFLLRQHEHKKQNGQ